MIVCKQGEDVHTSILAQMICHEFMTKYDYEGHLKSLQDLYRVRARRMMELSGAYMALPGSPTTRYRADSLSGVPCRMGWI